MKIKYYILYSFCIKNDIVDNIQSEPIVRLIKNMENIQ